MNFLEIFRNSFLEYCGYFSGEYQEKLFGIVFTVQVIHNTSYEKAFQMSSLIHNFKSWVVGMVLSFTSPFLGIPHKMQEGSISQYEGGREGTLRSRYLKQPQNSYFVN